MARMKKCAGCLTALPIESFGISRGERDGRVSRCRDCLRAEREARKQRDESSLVADWYRIHPDGLARCRPCGRSLPPEAFQVARSLSSGRTAKCKQCIAEDREERASRTEEVKDAEWGRLNPSGVRACSSCGELKSIDGYYRKAGAVGGRHRECADCFRPKNAERLRRYAAKMMSRTEVIVPDESSCVRCREVKPEFEFARSRRQPSGLHHTCKACHNQYTQIRYFADLKSFWQAHGIEPSRCVCCPTGKAESVDHLFARSQGGTDDITNLAPMCSQCNSTKGNRFSFDPMITPADYRWWVGKVSAKVAEEFVRLHHYSKTAHRGTLRYGLYFGPHLVGVTIYDAGAHSARASVFGKERASEVLHHHRLAISAECPEDRPQTSWFLAKAHRYIRRDRPSVKAVVTFADIEFGHEGTVYRAVNGVYFGVSSVSHVYWVTQEGVLVSQENLRGKGLSLPEKKRYAAESGWEMKRSAGKHKYVIPLTRDARREITRSGERVDVDRRHLVVD